MPKLHIEVHDTDYKRVEILANHENLPVAGFCRRAILADALKREAALLQSQATTLSNRADDKLHEAAKVPAAASYDKAKYRLWFGEYSRGMRTKPEMEAEFPHLKNI